MIAKIRANPVPFVFLATLVGGLALITAAAFTVSVFWGLLVAGTATVAAGHWITYLRTRATEQRWTE